MDRSDTILDTNTIDAIRTMGTPSDADDFTRELFQAFIDQSEIVIRDLLVAVVKKRPDQVKSLAHRLRGSSANVGASALSIQAERIESTVGGDVSDTRIKMAVLELQSIFRKTVRELEAFTS